MAVADLGNVQTGETLDTDNETLLLNVGGTGSVAIEIKTSESQGFVTLRTLTGPDNRYDTLPKCTLRFTISGATLSITKIRNNKNFSF